MKIISIFMSFVLSLFSIVVPVSESTQAQQKAEEIFSTIFPDDGTINAETYRILSGIFTNIVAEGISGESEAEDLIAIINEIPVYKPGERDATRVDIKISPFKKAFSTVASGVLESSSVSEDVKAFVRLIVNGVYDMYVYLVETDEENVYMLCYDFVDNFEKSVTVETQMRFNKTTGEVYNENGKGMLGTGFDYNVNNYLVTTPVDVWQRKFGYSIIYDILGEWLFMDCNTLRIKFEYEGKDWMVQLWKGNYSFDLLVGGEIGLYNKEKGKLLQYDCASSDEEMPMSMTISHEGEDIVVMSERVHWWMMGLCFKEYTQAEELTLSGTIDFKDAAMKDAFMEAAAEYTDCLKVTCEGNKVELIWK